MESGCRPTEDEVATRHNVSGEEFETLQKDSPPISMVSLTRKCFETDSSKDVREIELWSQSRTNTRGGLATGPPFSWTSLVDFSRGLRVSPDTAPSARAASQDPRHRSGSRS